METQIQYASPTKNKNSQECLKKLTFKAIAVDAFAAQMASA
jgi:hypothetical protein